MTPKAYNAINAAWPLGTHLPPLEPEEAVRAAKRLWKVARGTAWKGPVRVTSGRRYTRRLHGELVVNPERGWRDLVHLISHAAYAGGHDRHHADLEHRLITYVIEHDWLTGKLRKKPRAPKPPPTKDELRAAKLMHAEARIADWKRKAKLADTKLKHWRRVASGLRRALKPRLVPAAELTTETLAPADYLDTLGGNG